MLTTSPIIPLITTNLLGNNKRGVLWDSNSNKVDVHSTKARQRHVELIIARVLKSREKRAECIGGA